MANGINKVILVGNLGKDPEIRYTQNGIKIATFSIATSESWQDKTTNERRDTTQWHRIVIFNENLADIVEKYLKKGNKVFIEGSLSYKKYVDSNGIERNITEIVLNKFKGELQILDSRGDKQNTNSSSEMNDKELQNGDITKDLDDDIPF